MCLWITTFFIIYSAIKTDIVVASTTPAIPNFQTNNKDKLKFITVSAIAHFLVSLNKPDALTNVVIGIFTIYPNNYVEKTIAITKFVTIEPSYQISINESSANVKGTHITIATKYTIELSS